MLKRAAKNWDKREARHLLNRVGFGGSPSEVMKFYAMGREAAIDFLLVPEEGLHAFPLPDWSKAEVAMEVRRERFLKKQELQREIEGLGEVEAERLKGKFRMEEMKERRFQGLEAQGWWFGRMLQTEAPLREKMVLFWHDHFPSSLQKVRVPALVMQQNALFREYALGNFRTLTEKVVTDPAMMLYLDTQKSSKKQPNENFARELMELFTLGEGNYTEQDVKEVARSFTGYRLDPRTGEVSVKKFAQDTGEKEVFGERGNFGGMEVVDLIFKKEQCAEFLVRKLWVYFCYSEPSDVIVRGLGKVFRESGYEVGVVLREMFGSEEFYGEEAVAEQIKCPVQYLIQMLKELEFKEAPVGFPLAGQTQLGQQLFMPPNVAGWDWGKAWVNTNTLLSRYNLAGRLTKGGFGGGKGEGKARKFFKEKMGKEKHGGQGPDFEKMVPMAERADTGRLVDGLMERFFCGPVSEKARDSFLEYAEAKRGGEFSDKEVGELCHLMMSTPYYQLC